MCPFHMHVYGKIAHLVSCRLFIKWITMFFIWTLYMHYGHCVCCTCIYMPIRIIHVMLWKIQKDGNSSNSSSTKPAGVCVILTQTVSPSWCSTRKRDGTDDPHPTDEQLSTALMVGQVRRLSNTLSIRSIYQYGNVLTPEVSHAAIISVYDFQHTRENSSHQWIWSHTTKIRVCLFVSF